MKTVCPNCEKETEQELIQRDETYTIKSRKIHVRSEFYLCKECNEEYATPKQIDCSLSEGYAKYRELEDIISPEEIVKIREKYNASQKAFAKILDLGELTINSYEQGSLCSKAVSNLIKMVENSENFKKLYKKNKNKLSVHQRKKIEEKIPEHKVPLYFRDPEFMAEHIGEAEAKYTGNNHPDWNKITGLFQLIIYFSGKKLFKLALLKIAFYCDFISFSRNACSITGWPYVAITYGPVPDEWKSILRICDENDLLQCEIDEITSGDLYSLPKKINIDLLKTKFKKKELDIISEVTKRLKNKTATELKELTHEEKAWIETQNAKRIDFSYALTLNFK